MPLQAGPVRSKVNWVSVGESLVVDCTESRSVVFVHSKPVSSLVWNRKIEATAIA